MALNSQSKIFRHNQSLNKKILRPSRREELLMQYNNIKEKVNNVNEKQQEKSLPKLPSLQKISSAGQKNSIELASPYSPFKFSSKKEVSIEKSNHSKLSSINRKSLELSDLKDGKVYKKSDISFKIYKKPPKTPILKANMKVWKEYEKSEFIFPKQFNGEEKLKIQAYWKNTNSFIKLIKGDPEALQPLQIDTIQKIYGCVYFDSQSFFLVDNEFDKTLDFMIGHFGNLPEKLLKIYLSQIIEGTLSLHNENFLHNQLNLESIVTNTKGQIRIDYVAANQKKIKKENLQSNGFYFYSPQALIKCKESQKNDVWAIGCIAISLFYGKKVNPSSIMHPYNSVDKDENEKNDDLIGQIKKKYKRKCGKEIKGKKLKLEMSQYLQSFIQGCLEVDKEKRLKMLEIKNHLFLI